MTIYHKLRTINVLLLLSGLLLSACPDSKAVRKVDLSTPEATIKAYCQGTEITTAKKHIYYGAKSDGKSFEKPIWTDCTIIEKREAGKVGQYLGDESKLFIQSGDIEIITEVKIKDPKKGNPNTRFWYLLRNFEGEWKIISHSHIPDTNYPAYD